MQIVMEKKEKNLLPGTYILRNNGYTDQICKGLEKGIMLSDRYYLDISTLLRTPISREEAKRYGQQHNMVFPSKAKMQLLQKNIAAVNISLMRIGLTDCFLSDDVMQEFWVLREKQQNQQQRKRVAFIVAIE